MKQNKVFQSYPDVTDYNDIKNIKVHYEREHRKASERYLDVIFTYEDAFSWEGSIPIEYRRTGTNLSEPLEIKEHLLESYDCCHPIKQKEWLAEQEEFWQGKSRAQVTKSFFDALTTFQWSCITCELPYNRNAARRIQDLKEFGYTIATNTSKLCKKCDKKQTHLILVPLPRGGISGYETWSPLLRKRIVALLKNYDAYEGRTTKKESLLPDHKFPEIRWDSDTRRETLKNLSNEEIKNEFQLMSNQRNLQKREVCRKCYQTNIRGYPFGIKFYYRGNETWAANVPKTGNNAQKGCIGCGWYDFETWREALNQKLAESAGDD